MLNKILLAVLMSALLMVSGCERSSTPIKQTRHTAVATYDADISDDGKLSNEKSLLDSWQVPGDVTWSPDDKWLAYSLTNLEYNDEIYIHAADNSKEAVNVSMHPRGDYSPKWSGDGS